MCRMDLIFPKPVLALALMGPAGTVLPSGAPGGDGASRACRMQERISTEKPGALPRTTCHHTALAVSERLGFHPLAWNLT